MHTSHSAGYIKLLTWLRPRFTGLFAFLLPGKPSMSVFLSFSRSNRKWMTPADPFSLDFLPWANNMVENRLLIARFCDFRVAPSDNSEACKFRRSLSEVHDRSEEPQTDARDGFAIYRLGIVNRRDGISGARRWLARREELSFYGLRCDTFAISTVFTICKTDTGTSISAATLTGL